VQYKAFWRMKNPRDATLEKMIQSKSLRIPTLISRTHCNDKTEIATTFPQAP
jgi:hypothetical protein